MVYQDQDVRLERFEKEMDGLFFFSCSFPYATHPYLSLSPCYLLLYKAYNSNNKSLFFPPLSFAYSVIFFYRLVEICVLSLGKICCHLSSSSFRLLYSVNAYLRLLQRAYLLINSNTKSTIFIFLFLVVDIFK